MIEPTQAADADSSNTIPAHCLSVQDAAGVTGDDACTKPITGPGA